MDGGAGRSDAGGRTTQTILGAARRIYRKQLLKGAPWVRAAVSRTSEGKGDLASVGGQ